MKIYDNRYLDLSKEPMFLGEGRNSQRFDVNRFQYMLNNREDQLGCFWIPEEIDLTRDALDIEQLSEKERRLFRLVIQKLIFLDSIQGRGILLTLGQLTTLPELENLMLTWEFFEGAIHSYSYSYMLRSLEENPKEIFDSAFSIEPLKKIADSISRPYEELYNYATLYHLSGIPSTGRDYRFSLELSDDFEKNMKKAIVRLLITIYILEGIRFYSGFASIWYFAEFKSLLKGSANIFKFICRDENLHLAAGQFIISNLKHEEGFRQIFREMHDEIIDMFRQAYQEEIDWIEYIDSDIKEDLKMYIKYLIKQRMRSISLEPFIKERVRNPIKWINHWIIESSNTKSPQETEEEYRVAVVNNDLLTSEEIIKKFKKEW